MDGRRGKIASKPSGPPRSRQIDAGGLGRGGDGLTRADLQIQPKTIQQQTVERLRSAISEGVFQPGERLVEVEVAGLLGISRPSLREALRSLESERLVTIVPNRGPHVSVVTWAEAGQIYHVRKLLEGEAAALAAEHVEAHHLEQMRCALEDFRAAVTVGDRRSLIVATTAFYRAVVDGCGNRIIAEMQAHLYARISFLRDRSMSNPARPRESLKEMTAIYEAIKRRDAEAARLAAVRHVDLACSAALAAYKESDGET